jgi:drug/metabolite transporter (DMT)-like permease
VAILLGLGAALSYGAADFLGGLLSRRANVVAVVLISQIAGAVLLIPLLPIFSEGAPAVSDLLWGAATGVAGGAGVILLYQGLGKGRMGVVAPITAVEAASIPVLFGLVTGERPPTLSLIGVFVALLSVALVSAGSSEGSEQDNDRQSDSPSSMLAAPGLVEAFAAGLAFGAFFILLKQAGTSSGLWPLAGARVTSVAVVLIAGLASRSSFRASRELLPLIVAAGALDLGANVLYLLGSRLGLLSIVAVLTSMYPASTVILARVALKEEFSKPQVVGLAAAAAGILLITAG